MTHTPGPWYWVKYPKTKTIRLMGAGQRIVMDFTRWGMQSAQPRFIHVAPSGLELMIDAEDIDLDADLNARLIAAAPDLIEKSQSLVNALPDCIFEWIENGEDIGAANISTIKTHRDALRAAIAKAKGE